MQMGRSITILAVTDPRVPQIVILDLIGTVGWME